MKPSTHSVPVNKPHQRVTAYSLWESIRLLLQSYGPLKRAGIYPQRPSKQTPIILKKIYRWGMSPAMSIEMNTVRSPHSLALVDDLGERTYQELRDDAWAFARALRARGVAPGDTIAVYARNGRGMLYALVACGYLGTRMMVINPFSSGAQAGALIRDYHADVLVVDAEYSASVETDPSIIRVTGYGHCDGQPGFQDLIDEDAQVEMPKKVRPQPMLVMSSGTTGTPKGVLVRTPRTPMALGGIVQRIPWRPHCVVQQTASMFHGWGLVNLNIALGLRATIIFRRYFDAAQAADDAVKYNVEGIISSAIFLTDFMHELDKRGAQLPRLRFVVHAGNVLPTQLIRRMHRAFGPVMFNFYGTTENNQIAIATPEDLERFPTTVGLPTLGSRVHILDDAGHEVPRGTVGTIYSAHALTFSGYASQRDKVTVANELLSTGDLGYMNEEGYLFVAGRGDDMVIRGGENVFPREAEDVLLSLDGVAEVFVQGDQAGKLMADIHAWIVREDSEAGHALTTEDVQDWVREKLAEHNVPNIVHWVDELPWNDTGKVVPRLLPDEQGDSSLQDGS